jgi:hypothetical protein
MSDEEIINKAYGDTIQLVFTTFYQACILARTDEEQRVAEQKFGTGVTFARQVRDRAIAILAAG